MFIRGCEDVSLKSPRRSPSFENHPAVKVDPEGKYKVFINLPQYRQIERAGTSASQIVLAHIIDLIKRGYTTFEINCGNESKRSLFGYTRSKATRQAQLDVSDLDSARTKQLITDRTGMNVEIKRLLDHAGNTLLEVEAK